MAGSILGIGELSWRMENGPDGGRWVPGGLIGDVLAEIVDRLGPVPRPRTVGWSGAIARRRHPGEPLTSPVDDLRRRGIAIHRQRLIDHYPLTPPAVGVALDAALDAVLDVPGSPDLLLVEPGALASPVPPGVRVAVLVGGPDVACGRLRDALEAGRVTYVIGDPAALARLDPGTGGAEWLPVDVAGLPAAAAAYLLARLAGTPADLAAREAEIAARKAEGETRPPHEDDLNAVFSHLTGRTSADEREGRLFDRVRRAAGPVIVVGGQTGVNQLVLSVTAGLGLPSFCVLPEGRRTERTERILGGVDDFGDAHLTVLGGHSYRHRTWTTVYIADGTVTWDPRRSEGSATAREAAGILGRPWLDLTGIPDDSLPGALVGWVRENGIRVINIEGNRGSLLSPEQHEHARVQLGRALRAVAAAHAADRGGAVWTRSGAARDRPLRLGVSAGSPYRRLIGRFLADAFGHRLPTDRRLVHSFAEPDLRVVLARSADLPALLAEGAVDVIVCGSDVLAGTGLTPVLDTGLRPLLFGLVGGRGGRVGSQYGDLADTVLRRTEPVRRIAGAGEAWVVEGLLDAVFDSWHTGATAEAHGLDLREAMLSTSVVVAGDAGWLIDAIDDWARGRR